jgi:putative ABC transport system permease protein
MGVTRVLAALLTGVSPTDPVTFSLVAAVLIGSSVAGCAIPARRAMQVDPAVALRHE